MLHFARRAIALRRDSAGLRLEDFTLIKADENLLVFTRRYCDESLLCLLNLGHETGHFLLPSSCEEIAALGTRLPAAAQTGTVRLCRPHLMGRSANIGYDDRLWRERK